LKLGFLDEFDNPIDAEFLFSITDPMQVIQMDQEIRLDQAMESFAEDLPETFQSSFSYPVEYGISIQGKFTPDNKRQPLITPITVVQGDLEDFGQVLPDSLGNFWVTGLTFPRYWPK